MGAVCSTNGEDALHSQLKRATMPKCNDLHRPAPVVDTSAPTGQEDIVLDVHSWEAALVEHHLALRRFVSEWMESQEQLLSLGTRNVIDGAASSDHARSNTTASLAADGKGAYWTPMQKDDLLGSNPQKRRAAPLDADQEMIVVPHRSMDTPDSCQTSNDQEMDRVRTVRSQLSMLSMDSEGEQVARTLQWLESVSLYFEGVDARLQRRFPCPLLSRIEKSSAFSTICGLIILLNALTMAVSADYEMSKSFQQGPSEALHIIELTFVGIYTLELVIRIMVKKIGFFCVTWNWFDFIIVSVGWIEVVSYYLPSLSHLRLLRMLKMMKVMRVLRVMRSLREVRLLLNSLMGSVKALFWTIVIITGMNFMFGIYFVQSLSETRYDNLEAAHGGKEALEPEQLEAVLSPWSSVMTAMYTLFKVSTGGASWGDFSDELLQLGMQTFFVFLLYMALFMFVIINAVTAVFVASTEEYANKDADSIQNEQLLRKEQYMKHVSSLYQEMVGEQSGEEEVTQDVFLEHILDPRMVSFAHSLEIETSDLVQFFDVLSSKGEQGVNIDTFVDGCIRLRGAAKSKDVYDLLIHQQTLAKEVCSIRALIEQGMPRAQR